MKSKKNRTCRKVYNKLQRKTKLKVTETRKKEGRKKGNAEKI